MWSEEQAFIKAFLLFYSSFLSELIDKMTAVHRVNNELRRLSRDNSFAEGGYTLTVQVSHKLY